jgi:hypothetical protein
MADDLVHEPAPDLLTTAPETSTQTDVPPVPNYHLVLWPAPPGTPPTSVCLLCAQTETTDAAMQAHVTEVHGLSPLPTPTAARRPILEEATGLLAFPSQEGSNDG